MKHELRPFRFWEQICSTMNLSLAFELQGPITADLISKAWGLIKTEHPYFASTIHQDEYGQLHFKSGTGEVSISVSNTQDNVKHAHVIQSTAYSLQ